MAISNTDLKFFLTSIDPAIEQADPSLSIGGYASFTPLSTSTSISSYAGRTSTSLSVVSGATLAADTFALVDDEFVNITQLSGNSLTVSRGSLQTTSRVQIVGQPVAGLQTFDLFGGDFNADLKQYRCVALQNTNQSSQANNVSVYVRYPSLNTGSTFRFAVEVPSNDTVSGTVSAGTSLSLTDTSIPTAYANNAFLGAVLTMTSGANSGSTVTVASYDQPSKTLTFVTRFLFPVAAGDSYTISSGPSQRLLSGTVTPATDTTNVSAFSSATCVQNACSIGFMSHRVHGSSLYPNDVVYVWIERTLTPNSQPFKNNRVVFAVSFSC